MKLMNKKLAALALAAAFTTITACGSDDDDGGGTAGGGDGDGDGGDTVTVSEPGSFQVTFTNMTTNHLLTPPVVALHDSGVHLFQIGETSSDAIRDIAETGDNAALVAFAEANTAVVSAATVAGMGPIPPGASATANLTTTVAGQVFSSVNMVICTNDTITGVDSLALPADNTPLIMMTTPYDAGTRENSSDAQSFFPPPCKVGDTVPNDETSPRAAIAAHPGQSGVANVGGGGPIMPPPANWDFEAGAEVMMIEIVRN